MRSNLLRIIIASFQEHVIALENLLYIVVSEMASF